MAVFSTTSAGRLEVEFQGRKFYKEYNGADDVLTWLHNISVGRP